MQGSKVPVDNARSNAGFEIQFWAKLNSPQHISQTTTPVIVVVKLLVRTDKSQSRQISRVRHSRAAQNHEILCVAENCVSGVSFNPLRRRLDKRVYLLKKSERMSRRSIAKSSQTLSVYESTI
jgi:hypothetical protein